MRNWGIYTFYLVTLVKGGHGHNLNLLIDVSRKFIVKKAPKLGSFFMKAN